MEKLGSSRCLRGEKNPICLHESDSPLSCCSQRNNISAPPPLLTRSKGR